MFDLLGWRPSARESFRECPARSRPCTPALRGLDGYAHWFNWRSPDRFEQLAAAVAAVTMRKPREPRPPSDKARRIHAARIGFLDTDDRRNGMGDVNRLQRLCELETGQQPQSSTDPIYSAWMKSKRPFTRDEVVGLLHAQIRRAMRRLSRPLQRRRYGDRALHVPTRRRRGHVTGRSTTPASFISRARERTIASEPVRCNLDIVASPQAHGSRRLRKHRRGRQPRHRAFQGFLSRPDVVASRRFRSTTGAA